MQEHPLGGEIVGVKRSLLGLWRREGCYSLAKPKACGREMGLQLCSCQRWWADQQRTGFGQS